MRIIVNNIAASQTGALTILKSFYDYVDRHGREHEWIFLLGAPYLEEKEHIKVVVLDKVKKNWLNRLTFDLWNGKNYIKTWNPDLVFSLQNTIIFGYNGRQIVYVHQPLGFQKVKNFSFFKKKEREYAVYQYLIGALINASIKRADKTIVQTKWMRDAILEKTGIEPKKVVNILPDIEDIKKYFKKEEEETFDCHKFFFPSGDILYKNHETVIKACQILNKKGYNDFQVLFTLKDLTSVTDISYDNRHGNIVCVGKLMPEELFSYYRKATLIFPSYIETLGLPLIEGKMAGSMILASHCPFCLEILEGYENVKYFEPFDEERLAAYMEDIMAGRLKRKKSKAEDGCKEKSSWFYVVKELTGEGTGRNGKEKGNGKSI